ncbi:Bis(5'-adenosyl)-triphosphatase [Gossypium arboreum]|uniref:Bis(5'-adenosyl)-triphosphatase n=1 Tax=Gossypium arboreum TaxID=29729 RepID=A0A0B0MT72_GOSAR|nr:Bis(5'-adenosyl)-triphosphatase [Gossypium arboreum]
MTKLQLLRGFQTIPLSGGASPAKASGKTYPSCTGMHPKMSMEFYSFGPYKIDPTEVFYTTPLSYAMVNLRPVVPETQDLWLTAQKIGGRLECFHKASSLTFTIQDGPKAGQTVPHVHIHILPRKDGDFERNDEIYDEIDVKENELKEKLNLDKERKDRSREEMCKEAEEYSESGVSGGKGKNEGKPEREVLQ